jgi:Protein of unknown function, DUF547
MKYITLVFLVIFSTNLSAQLDYTNYEVFLKKYVNSSGAVNYKSIKENNMELNKIVVQFEKVTKVNSYSKEEQLAFWINTYNIFTIKLIADNYPLQSIQKLDGGKTWDIKRVTTNGSKYSLNQIENDLIRAQFKDARIHFAVNCAAKSCPPLQNFVFTPKILDNQLTAVTKKYCNNINFITSDIKSISVSKIFDWYMSDFGNIVDFINKYRTVKSKNNLKIVYKDYDWSLNELK